MSMPQMPQPQQPPAPRKTSPIVWILIAVVGLMFMVGIVLAVGSYFVYKKVKQVAGGNPANIVSMLASMNPDFEVIRSDEGSGTVTIKDKKNGKVITMNLDDLKNGRMVVKEDGKDTVTIQTSGGKDGQGIVDIKSADGTAHFGSGSGRMPAWIPVYPGSSPEGHYNAQTDKADTGSYSFKTGDNVEKVSKYYQDTLKDGGFKVDTMMAMGSGGVVTGKMDDDKRTVIVTLGGDSRETTVSVIFNEKK